MLENPEGRRSLGKPRSRWDDNIKVDRREIEWSVVDWIHHFRVVNSRGLS
jgi:hypothetical protein